MRAFKVVLLMMLMGATQIANAQQMDGRVKAVYIYNFVQLTVWPGPHPGNVFNLCLYGPPSMDTELAKLEGRPVQEGAHIKVRHLSVEEDASFCQMVYLDSTNSQETELLLRKLASKPIVTVTDAHGLTDRGFMIEMGRSRHHMGFEINLGAARQVNVNFDARLLRLARSVNAG